MSGFTDSEPLKIKDGRPLKEGHMWIKRGKFRKTWKIYWFVLKVEDMTLSYYASPQVRLVSF